MLMWLVQRSGDSQHVGAVLARLKERGYLDDARYAKQYARSRVASRRLGRFRVARDLRARGVPDRHIEAALDEIFADTDQAALLRGRIERKLRSLRDAHPRRRHGQHRTDTADEDAGVHAGATRRLDQRRYASLYASLLRAGFPADLIRRELKAFSEQAEALPDAEEIQTTDEP
ncbi:MAG: regulatory protein RecX [Candidatus Acidiferrales bacterium]